MSWLTANAVPTGKYHREPAAAMTIARHAPRMWNTKAAMIVNHPRP